MTVALVPGSFDPITTGHMDIITRAAKTVDTLIVGVFVNAQKTPFLSVEKRVELIQKACAHLPNVRVISSDGMLADYAVAHSIPLLIKGVRNEVDFAYETEMANFNRAKAPSVETVFLPADPAYAQISSSIVRKMHAEGRPLTGFIPQEIEGCF